MDGFHYWVIIYLAMGLTVLIGCRLFNHHKRKQHDEFSREILECLDRQYPKPIGKAVLDAIGMSAVFLVFMALWPLCIVAVIWRRRRTSSQVKLDNKAEAPEFLACKAALLRRVTIGEIERAEMVSDPLGAVPDVPFGHLNTTWESFKDKLLLDDEVWSFSLSIKADEAAGRADGYVVLRDGRIIKEFCAHFVGSPN